MLKKPFVTKKTTYFEYWMKMHQLEFNFFLACRVNIKNKYLSFLFIWMWKQMQITCKALETIAVSSEVADLSRDPSLEVK